MIVDCPHCGRSFQPPGACTMGEVVQCQHCASRFTFRRRKAAAPPPLPAAVRTCPFCAEEIKIDAKKCRHCGELLDPILRDAARGRSRRGGDSTALVLSLILPGAGQMYKGELAAGICWLVGTVVGYLALFVPGIVIHVLCIIDAGKTRDAEA